MLTLKDCLDFCDLTEDEIKAIAEHERVPEIVAIELGQCLMHVPKGTAVIHAMIDDGIVAAQTRGDDAHAAKLESTMRRFDGRHTAGTES